VGAYESVSGQYGAITNWGNFNAAKKKFREAGSEWPSGTDTSWYSAAINEGANGYRLPGFHQWRWAAMSAGKLINGVNMNDKSKPFAGSSRHNNVDDYAWYFENRYLPGIGSPYSVFQVGLKKPNDLGLLRHEREPGEWCFDRSDGGEIRSLRPGPMSDTDYNMVALADGGFVETSPPGRLIMGGWVEDRIGLLGLANFNKSEFDEPQANIGLRVMRYVENNE
jgi:hypothetical protein